MMPFELVEPASLGEAVGCLDRAEPEVRAIAGGTALMLMMKSGLYRPTRLVSLRRIEPHHAAVAAAPDGTLRIGAMAPLARLERAPEVARLAPVITAALRRLSNRRVRNVATIGGHLAHADPHLDLPPVLTALDAAVVVAGRAGERVLPVADLITGYYETSLAPDELIATVVVPPQGRRRCVYVKCTARAADDWPALGVAVSLVFADGIMSDVRIVVGAATERPTRLAAAAAALAGAAPEEAVLRRAGEAASAEARLVGDQHGAAAYKAALLRVQLGRAVRRAVATAEGAP